MNAKRNGLITQRTGTARFTRDYYEVLAAAALGRLYDRIKDVSVFGSHPLGDVRFRQDLMESVVGNWYLEIKGTQYPAGNPAIKTVVLHTPGRASRSDHRQATGYRRCAWIAEYLCV